MEVINNQIWNEIFTIKMSSDHMKLITQKDLQT